MGILRETLTNTMIKKRHETERKRDKIISNIVDENIKKIKKYGNWYKISMGAMTKQYKLSLTDRYKFLYELESNCNIISRPQQISKNTNEISHSIPMEYKYVTKKEKTRLGYDAICFRKIQGNRKSIIERLRNLDNNVSIYDQLLILNNLYSFDADKRYVRLTMTKMINDIGMPFDNYINALEFLNENKIIVLKNVEKHNRGISFVCRIAKNEKMFDFLNFLSLNHMKIEENPIKTKTRAKRKTEKPVVKPIQKLSIEEYKNLLSKTNLENLELREQLKQCKKDLKKSKQIEQKLINYNNDFAENCLEELMVFLSNTFNMIDNVEKLDKQDHKVMEKIKKNIMELCGDYSKRIAEFHN